MIIENILLYTFISISVIHIFYLLINWKFILSPETALVTKTDAVSVIICAKNEENTLPSLLKKLEIQNYSEYEIVLINDASTDKTLEIMETFATKNSNITVVDVVENQRFWRGKKFALTMGIKRAKHNHLLFTDADCKPISNNWINSMMSAYSDDKSIILGYGAYEKTKGLLNKIIRFETVLTASNYFSYAKLFTPYMGVGRNLSYKKNLFFDNNGFYGHMDLASGDDDLFINKNGTKKNTEIVFSSDSITISEAPNTWSSWFTQKRRHYTTSDHYSKKTKSLLGLQTLSHVLFFTFLIILLVLKINLVIVLSIFLIRMIIYTTTIGISSSKLNEKDLILFVPFLDILLIILQIVIFISNKIIFPKRWH
jgi:glycosyltransferase involved in cell wall biosynthesis